MASLVERFRAATEPQERNRLAWELSESGEPGAKQALVDAIRDPRTEGARGSLVYALRKFPCEDHPMRSGTSVCDGSYEEVEHAVMILEGVNTELTVAQWGGAKARLAWNLRHIEDGWWKNRPEKMATWRVEAIRHVLSMFEDDA
jgi:hypothetical protein